ncbi:MAG: hypothetical protein BJ554DRAFT_6997, partial [Olpidium bornovanus]
LPLVVDAWRGSSNQSVKSKRLNTFPGYNTGSNYTRAEAERIARWLVSKEVFRERCEANGQGFVNAYVEVARLGSAPGNKRPAQSRTKVSKGEPLFGFWAPVPFKFIVWLTTRIANPRPHQASNQKHSPASTKAGNSNSSRSGAASAGAGSAASARRKHRVSLSRQQVPGEDFFCDVDGEGGGADNDESYRPETADDDDNANCEEGANPCRDVVRPPADTITARAEFFQTYTSTSSFACARDRDQAPDDRKEDGPPEVHALRLRCFNELRQLRNEHSFAHSFSRRLLPGLELAKKVLGHLPALRCGNAADGGAEEGIGVETATPEKEQEAGIGPVLRRQFVGAVILKDPGEAGDDVTVLFVHCKGCEEGGVEGQGALVSCRRTSFCFVFPWPPISAINLTHGPFCLSLAFQKSQKSGASGRREALRGHTAAQTHEKNRRSAVCKPGLNSPYLAAHPGTPWRPYLRCINAFILSLLAYTAPAVFDRQLDAGILSPPCKTCSCACRLQKNDMHQACRTVWPATLSSFTEVELEQQERSWVAPAPDFSSRAALCH